VNESKTMMVELNVGFSMGECRNLVMTSTDHDASLTYGHRKIGVPRRTGACKRALFVHAYERAELATAAVYPHPTFPCHTQVTRLASLRRSTFQNSTH